MQRILDEKYEIPTYFSEIEKDIVVGLLE